MLRRDFIKTTGAILAASTLTGSTALAAGSEDTTRVILPINRNWRYKAAKVEGAHLATFNDASFERIVVPHTNVRLPWHNFDEKLYTFVSTYRRHFRYPAAAKGNRVFVDFEGVMTASMVWINGVALGEYRGGFTPFSFELTPHLKQDGENVLVVQVDSTERADIPPFGNEIDYLTFGGLYREVSLRIVPQNYIDNIFARPKDALSGSPSIDVDCFLVAESRADLSLEVELRDGDKVLGKASGKVNAVEAANPNAAAGPVTSAAVHARRQTQRGVYAQ